MFETLMNNIDLVIWFVAALVVGAFAWYDCRGTLSKPDYLDEHGCDSCCPNCEMWESDGNVINTEPLEDGTDQRTCTNCNHTWLAIFTPAGFIPLDDCKKTEHKLDGKKE
ncbi:hypothetical protein ACRXCV_00135 (plasmid) [Halobacteriovorax sp. GFR7]|uniref:hypothetical protein n=1 Tax=unclassified Halobacteriovorax TaxID=2639665 RepID=UPI003D964AB2